MRSYPITPVTSVTVTHKFAKLPPHKLATSDKGRALLKYRAYQDEIALMRVVLYDGEGITFVMPMPKSWNKKKKAEMDGQPHRQRPDRKNLLWAFEDAVQRAGRCKHAWKDDCELADLGRLRKIWGYTGAIQIWSHDEPQAD